ncbi:MAG: hypothetical protein WB816_13455 [Methylocystis sp.]
MIRPSGTHRNKSNAFMAVAVVWALALQMLFSGVALAGGVTADATAGFRLNCAQQTDTGPEGAPASPKAHHHGACCILHSNVFHVLSDREIASRVEWSDEASVPPTLYRVEARRAAPELGPLSPRAPPFSII